MFSPQHDVPVLGISTTKLFVGREREFTILTTIAKMYRIRKFNGELGPGRAVTVTKEYASMSPRDFAEKYPDVVLQMKAVALDILIEALDNDDSDPSRYYKQIIEDVTFGHYPWHHANQMDDEEEKYESTVSKVQSTTVQKKLKVVEDAHLDT